MNIRIRNFLSITLLLSNITASTISTAAEIIRANFEFQDSNHTVDFSLFDNLASGTVANYLSYVDDGSYNNLIINRSIPGFIIQMGAYTFDPFLNNGSFTYDSNLQFNGGLQLVPSKGEIINEFKISNIRGTLAMAKVGGQIDSASNQWFINLSDNSFLDTENGGFTVFGEVLGNGMNEVDLISEIPIYDLSDEINLNDSFLSIPLADYLISATVDEISNSNLVKISSFERLFNLTDIIDVGDAVINTSTQKDIIVKNNNIAALQIGTIDTSSITTPFSIISNPCQNKLLQLGEQCVIQVKFNPDSSDFFVNSFNVEILTYGYTFPVVLKTPAPDIVPVPSAAVFGVQPVYNPNDGFPEQRVIRINNRGDRTLNITSILFNTQSSNEFEFTDNCTENSAHSPGTVPPGEFCIVIVNFKPVDLSEKYAVISINSDDPLNGQLDLQVTGGSSSDDDGIDNSIEDAAPNNGDGNNDAIPDRLQNNVVSFPNTTVNTYTTLISGENLLFTNVRYHQLSSLEKLPDGITLGNDAFSFELSGFPVGSISEFGIILPAGNSPTNMYAYGPTPDNSTPHWYILESDETQGVISFGNVSLLDSSGNSVSKNITMIRILDGGYGDSDQQVNGKILFTGGPEITNATSTDTGGLLWVLIIIPLFMSMYRKELIQIDEDDDD